MQSSRWTRYPFARVNQLRAAHLVKPGAGFFPSVEQSVFISAISALGGFRVKAVLVHRFQINRLYRAFVPSPRGALPSVPPPRPACGLLPRPLRGGGSHGDIRWNAAPGGGADAGFPKDREESASENQLDTGSSPGEAEDTPRSPPMLRWGDDHQNRYGGSTELEPRR